MVRRSHKTRRSDKRCRRILSSTSILAVLAFGGVAHGQPQLQTQQQTDESQTDETEIEEIVVTGSRIRRSTADRAAPITDIGAQDFDDRGYVSAADALNQVPSLSPQLNQAPGTGASAGSGQQFPDLFGIGPGRTLTLVNGRRFVTTSNGLEEPRVDANVIPTALINRIEIAQAGGAAVYGSDAIAGVVNYILKDDFEGFQIDSQLGQTEEGDFLEPVVRVTGGFNFDGNRGNVAASVEWSKTPSLLFTDRDQFVDRISLHTAPNPENTGPADGIPDRVQLFDQTFFPFNGNGVIFGSNSIPPCSFTFPGVQPPPIPPCFTRLEGSPIQFSEDGQEIVPFDPGAIVSIPFAEGGDGRGFEELVRKLRTGVKRLSANVIGHYDLTDGIRVNTELLFARTIGNPSLQGPARTVLSPVGSGSEAIRFFNDNPFLSPSTISALTAARPAFGAGAPLFVSKDFFQDILPTDVERNKTTTYRGLLEFAGDFDIGDRDFYWTVSGSFARVEGDVDSFDVHTERFFKAVDAVSDGAGGAACRVNIDSDPANDDPDCVAFNPFGFGQSSQAARDFVVVPTGEEFNNEQIDVLATVGTTLFTLPTGEVKTALTYEHRDENAAFIPSIADQLGLVGTGTTVDPTSGNFNTDEIAAELLVPIIGNDFSLPLVELLEVSGSYRFVDNSITESENVWAMNARWVVSEDLTLRATRSRNFRAPQLNQLFQPTSVSLTQIGGEGDPCDSRNINEGPVPDVRRANCEALFNSNPDAPPLDAFQNESDNFTSALITSGGNLDLENEVSRTWTYGLVLQPRFIPGLTLSVDRIDIELTDGLVLFETGDFAAVCFDSSPQPAEICNTFTREFTNPNDINSGSIVTGRNTFVNAGIIRFKGEVYFASYDVPLDSIFKTGDPGRLTLTGQATHTDVKAQSVTGFDLSRTQNTLEDPDWVARFDAAYEKGPYRFTYQLFYLDSVKAVEGANIDNNVTPHISSNITHAISGLYNISDNVSLRAGVTNLTDKFPSFPTFTHGDVIGRRFFVGVNFRL